MELPSSPSIAISLLPRIRLVVLGVVNGKRLRGLQKAAKAFPDIDLHVCNYRDVINNPTLLLTHLQEGCWLKIDSPGEDPVVQRMFIEQGWVLNKHLNRALATPTHFGELIASDDWFAGFAYFLHTLESMIPSAWGVRWFNTVNAILLMTDKWRCQNHLQQAQVPTPKLLGLIRNYDDLQAQMAQNTFEGSQVFVKSRYGSSASGVVAFRCNHRGQLQASSTTIFDNGRAFNEKRIQTYQNEVDVALLIDKVAQYGAYAEAWIPKPVLQIKGKASCKKSFDFRCLTLAGMPTHQVARASRSPITNLHLDNERISTLDVRHFSNVSLLQTTIEQAACCFMDAHAAGFDIICSKQRAWVLEVNAFGDLLPGLKYLGQDTYSTQLAYLSAQEEKHSTRA